MTNEQIERMARRRAGAKMGWFIHATVYIVVNAMLAALAMLSDRNWAIFPAVGWGIGLAIHGAVVFLTTGGGGLHDRMVQQERERLTATRDAW